MATFSELPISFLPFCMLPEVFSCFRWLGPGLSMAGEYIAGRYVVSGLMSQVEKSTNQNYFE